MIKKTYKVNGMHCPACATSIGFDLEDIGIKASCSYAKQTLEVEKNGNKAVIRKVLRRRGYDLA